MNASPRVAVVMVNFRDAAETMACLDSLAAAGGARLGVYVIENGSGDGSGEALSGYAAASAARGMAVTVLPLPLNLGFAGGSNAGIRAALEAGYTHVALLNNDTRVEAGFAEGLLGAAAAHPEAVVAGHVAEMDSGRPAYNFGRVGRLTFHIDFDFSPRGSRPREFDFLSGCLMLVPAAVLRRVGLLRDDFFMYCEDLEFCLRLKRAGVPFRYDPSVAVRHRVNHTVDRTAFPKDYYRVRNQVWTVMRLGNPAQRVLFLVRLLPVLVLKLRDPALLRQFLAGIRDGLAGRLGHLEVRRA